MTTTIDKTIETFPHPVLPKSTGEPTYETIEELSKLLRANAAAIDTELGGGRHGHLALTVSPAVYNTISITPFVAPVNPGAVPVIEAGLTAAQIAAVERTHKEELQAWRTYSNTERALKQQLIRSIEPKYLRPLWNRYTAYANTTTLAILQHLLQTYGMITEQDHIENGKRFSELYDPEEPIEVLFTQIEDCIHYADAGGAPYTAAQILHNAYYLVFSTGQYKEACREWRMLTPVQKTWTQFQAHFSRAHADRKIEQRASQQGNYHTANAVFHEYMKETNAAIASTTEMLANMATEKIEQQKMASNQHTTIAELKELNRKQTEMIATLQQMLVQKNQQPNQNNNNSNNNGGQQNRNTTSNNNEKPVIKKRFKNMNYCWTHGYDISKHHTSANCTQQMKGHDTTATREDNKGGSQANKYKV